MLSKLNYDELFEIVKGKDLEVENVTEYKNLQTEMVFICKKCGRKVISTFGTIRNANWSCPLCDSQVVKKVSCPPPKNGYRIVGCDQATQHFGISVYDNGQLMYYDCIEFTGDVEKRYAAIMDFMEMMVDMWEPDFVAFEDIQLQQGAVGGYNAFKVLGGLLGIMKAVLTKKKIPHREVLNKVWQAKFMIGGKDRVSQKKNVIKKVKELFGIDVNDDVADAILIGKWAVGEKKESTKKLF